MAPYSNDATYCILPSCKKLKLSWTVLKKISKKSNFWHLVPFNPWISIFFKIPAVSWPLTSCKVSEKTNEQFPRYLKTDQRTDQGMDQQTNKCGYYYYIPHQVNPGSTNKSKHTTFETDTSPMMTSELIPADLENGQLWDKFQNLVANDRQMVS